MPEEVPSRTFGLNNRNTSTLSPYDNQMESGESTESIQKIYKADEGPVQTGAGTLVDGNPLVVFGKQMMIMLIKNTRLQVKEIKKSFVKMQNIFQYYHIIVYLILSSSSSSVYFLIPICTFFFHPFSIFSPSISKLDSIL